MQPLLMDGDHVLVQQCTHAEAGNVVLFRHPYRTDIRIIKRIQDSNEDGAFLIGDNPEETTDSTSFGRVPWTHLIGRVHSKF
jgi:nickel-type superoxide dismutase maturation protease